MGHGWMGEEAMAEDCGALYKKVYETSFSICFRDFVVILAGDILYI